MTQFHLNKSHTSTQRKAVPDHDATAAVFHCGYGVWATHNVLERVQPALNLFFGNEGLLFLNPMSNYKHRTMLSQLNLSQCIQKSPAAFSVSLSASSIHSLPVCLFVMSLLLHIFSYYQWLFLLCRINAMGNVLIMSFPWLVRLDGRTILILWHLSANFGFWLKDSNGWTAEQGV